jgi:hypothetical protein
MKMKRLLELAGITSETYISESIPSSVRNQRFKYVGKTLELDPTENKFNSLDDFFAELRFSWDTSENEVKKYINSLSYEGGKIVSNHSGTKEVELVRY